MLQEQKRLIFLLALSLLVALPAHAALTAEGDKSQGQDACKSGSVSVTKGKVTGGTMTHNSIFVGDGSVRVLCVPAKPGEMPRVKYCGLGWQNNPEKCMTVDKLSTQGQNLSEMYEIVRQNGIREGGTDSWFTDTRSFLEQSVTQKELQSIDVIEGTRLPDGSVLGYATWVNQIGANAAENASPAAFRDEVDSAITRIQFLAATADQPTQAKITLPPGQYPPSLGLSYGVALHDATPPAKQGLVGLGLNPGVYTIRAQSPTTFEERWSSVPKTFDYRWSNVSPTSQPSPTFYQRLLGMFSIFKFW